jgi:hypothetical protein
VLVGGWDDSIDEILLWVGESEEAELIHLGDRVPTFFFEGSDAVSNVGISTSSTNGGSAPCAW